MVSNAPLDRIFPYFLVRFSGFSIQRLEALRCEASLGALARKLEAETSLKEAALRVLAALDKADRSAVRIARKIREVIRKDKASLPEGLIEEARRVFVEDAGSIVDYAAAHRRREEASHAFESSFERDVERCRDALRGIFAEDERLREAVFLESRSAYAGLEMLLSHEGPPNARSRKRERMALMYLQRFCAKNDTNSMCGPFALAEIAPRAEPFDAAIEDELAHRRTYLAYWAADALLRAFSARISPEYQLELRRNPTASLRLSAGDDPKIEWCTMVHDATRFFRRKYARARATPELVSIVRALDRPRTVSVLTEILGDEHGVDEEESEALLGALVESGLLLEAPVLPVGLYRPLDRVAARVRSWPENQRREADSALVRIEALIDRFQGAELEARRSISTDLDEEFRRITGEAATRAEGEHYADRALLYEDCCSEVRGTLDAETLTKLLPDIGLVLSTTAIPLELARENVRAWFAERYGEGRRIGVLEAHRAFDDDLPYTKEASTPAAVALSAHIRAVRDLLSAALDSSRDGIARVDPSRLRHAIRGAPGSDRAGYANIDLLVAKNGSSWDWILGEVHGSLLLPTTRFEVIPDAIRDRMIASMRRCLAELAGGRRTAQPVFLHTQATDRSYPLTTDDISMIGSSPREAIEFSALEIMLEQGEFRSFAGDTEIVPVLTYRPYPFFLYTSSLVPLLDEFSDRFFPSALLPSGAEDGDTPRLVLGDLVLRRAASVQRTSAVAGRLADPTDAGRFAGAQALRRDIGFGRHVFASIPGEPKPILVDFDSCFSTEALAHLVRQTAEDTSVRFSEMLPAPHQLALEGADGRRTSELRIAIYRSRG
jgi:hypothetical protein